MTVVTTPWLVKINFPVWFCFFRVRQCKIHSWNMLISGRNWTKPESDLEEDALSLPRKIKLSDRIGKSCFWLKLSSFAVVGSGCHPRQRPHLEVFVLVIVIVGVVLPLFDFSCFRSKLSILKCNSNMTKWDHWLADWMTTTMVVRNRMAGKGGRTRSCTPWNGVA